MPLLEIEAIGAKSIIPGREGAVIVKPLLDQFAERVNKERGCNTVRVLWEKRFQQDKDFTRLPGDGGAPGVLSYFALFDSGETTFIKKLTDEYIDDPKELEKRKFKPGQMEMAELRAVSATIDHLTQLRELLRKDIEISGPLDRMDAKDREKISEQLDRINLRH